MKSLAAILGVDEYGSRDLAADVGASVAVTFMAIPQGIAYAMIAGLPPAVGLYAATLPTIVGSIFRSSRHVVAGPTNALSLLVGAGLGDLVGVDPVAAALTLSLLVGIVQTTAGALRLGIIVDYISTPVVTGYITGAGLLIGIGQLHNLTATTGGKGNVAAKIMTWAQDLGNAQGVAIGVGAAVAAAIVGMRLIDKRIPGAIIALTGATLLSWWTDLGIPTIADLAPVPQGLPPLTMPTIDAGFASALLPLAIATTVLSLVESSAVARSVAAQSGQRLDLSKEFFGQGLANLTAAFTGGYPASGSLARTSINVNAGARSKLSGILSGVLMIGVLLVAGPVVNYTPVAALAGLLMVVAVDLVKVPRIKAAMQGRLGDALAFVATLIGTWVLPLDKAIYLGVVISIVLFLRRVRLLRVRRMLIDARYRLREIIDGERGDGQECDAIRILNVEGNLFFAAASELEAAIDAVAEPGVTVLVMRLKRTQGIDITAATALRDAIARLHKQGVTVVLVGMRPVAMGIMDAAGVLELVGQDNLFPTRPEWFEAMNGALQRAVELAGAHSCAACPVAGFIEHWPTPNGQAPAHDRD